MTSLTAAPTSTLPTETVAPAVPGPGASSLTRSRRPRSGSERAECLRAVGLLFDDPSQVDPAVAAVLFGPFRPVRDRFVALSSGSDAASVAASASARQASEANGAFNAAFRWWSSSVRSPRGGSRMRELKPLMDGKAVDAFLGLSCPEKVHRMDRLLLHVHERPGLGGAPALLAALVTATDALRQAVGAAEVARRARMAAVDALEAYEPVFDRTYGLLVRTATVVDPADTRADWPVFLRRKANRRRASAAATERTPGASAPATKTETKPETETETETETASAAPATTAPATEAVTETVTASPSVSGSGSGARAPAPAPAPAASAVATDTGPRAVGAPRSAESGAHPPGGHTARVAPPRR